MSTISLAQYVNMVREQSYQASDESYSDFFHRTYVYAESLYLQQFEPLPRKVQQLDRDRAKRHNDKEMTLDE